ncbi:alpha/beta hydrolase [Actinopolyspora mortivallis]|uniref:alpha/beta hydrolase n=1 Tax=Actinopolyspora mortivallis TaxID=33906 RepID=UPI00037F87CB|nr:alpha/beta hydrolase [Actinopolyspora mortivallis]
MGFGSRSTSFARGTGTAAGYSEHTQWTRYQEFFPGGLRIRQREAPEERWWSWRGVPIHLDIVRRPHAAGKLLVLHGIGGYGRMLAPYSRLPTLTDLEYLAPDLPGHGLSSAGFRITYLGWVHCVLDLIEAERARDGRPVVLFGIGTGGWLAYQVAARIPHHVAALLTTGLADPRTEEVRQGLVANPGAGVLSGIFAGVPLIPPVHDVPLRWLLDVTAVSNHARFAAAFTADGLGGARRIQLELFRSYLRLPPAVPPERFTSPPVLLAVPEEDRWIPGEHSRRFFARLGAPKRSVPLTRSGHLPTEESGLTQLDRSVRDFFEEFDIPH